MIDAYLVRLGTDQAHDVVDVDVRGPPGSSEMGQLGSKLTSPGTNALVKTSLDPETSNVSSHEVEVVRVRATHGVDVSKRGFGSVPTRDKRSRQRLRRVGVSICDTEVERCGVHVVGGIDPAGNLARTRVVVAGDFEEVARSAL